MINKQWVSMINKQWVSDFPLDGITIYLFFFFFIQDRNSTSV